MMTRAFHADIYLRFKGHADDTQLALAKVQNFLDKLPKDLTNDIHLHMGAWEEEPKVFKQETRNG